MAAPKILVPPPVKTIHVEPHRVDCEIDNDLLTNKLVPQNEDQSISITARWNEKQR